MGSFSSAPKIPNEDIQDRDVDLPEKMSKQELLSFCDRELDTEDKLVERSFTPVDKRTHRNNDEGEYKGAPLISVIKKTHPMRKVRMGKVLTTWREKIIKLNYFASSLFDRGNC